MSRVSVALVVQLLLSVVVSAQASGQRSTPVATSFVVTSPVAVSGGSLPVEYTCDGAGVSPALSWTGAPEGTRAFAVLMSTVPRDGRTKWNWIVHAIPASATGLPRDARGVGTVGRGSDGPRMGYQAPCSQGPGVKQYTFTVYALSAEPALPARAGDVTGEVFTVAAAPVTLATASLTLGYARSRAAR